MQLSANGQDPRATSLCAAEVVSQRSWQSGQRADLILTTPIYACKPQLQRLVPLIKISAFHEGCGLHFISSWYSGVAHLRTWMIVGAGSHLIWPVVKVGIHHVEMLVWPGVSLNVPCAVHLEVQRLWSGTCNGHGASMQVSYQDFIDEYLMR